jgi:HKD family nuclease
MSELDYIAQPAYRTTLDAIEAILNVAPLESLDVAAAYITSGGAHDLVGRLRTTLGSSWGSVTKRWITSFDYCRTDPVALEALMSLPGSSVRVYDAEFCLKHGGMPKIPFHPKAFLFRNHEKDHVLAGSGNISRSGLSRGVEAGLAFGVKRVNPTESTSAASMNALRNWYSAIWSNATPLQGAMLDQYRKLFDRADNLKNPTPTEDDLASGDTASGAISDKDLQKLRVCRHFWIEAGKITKNRGPKLPGNQLMMKRLSRVFFGFAASAVPENTLIGTIDISFSGGTVDPYSLTYSDNKMDKLNLPLPSSKGPVTYDSGHLLFTQLAPNLFNLTLGTKSNKAMWLAKSKSIDGAFKMTSGREWGVF